MTNPFISSFPEVISEMISRLRRRLVEDRQGLFMLEVNVAKIRERLPPGEMGGGLPNMPRWGG